jgi:hypothetical protein
MGQITKQGLGCYKTAWLMLQKLRQAMVRVGRDTLTGTVEVDETYAGGEETGVGGRQLVGKALAVIAVELDGKKVGRIRVRHVRDADLARRFQATWGPQHALGDQPLRATFGYGLDEKEDPFSPGSMPVFRVSPLDLDRLSQASGQLSQLDQGQAHRVQRFDPESAVVRAKLTE